MPEKFTHLHCHTTHSFLDGVGRSAEYAELAAESGQTALAITDHGGLHGLPAHRRACEKFGLKPIYGCEMYANDDRAKTKEINADIRKQKIEKSGVDPTYTDAHIVLLAQSQAGWQNLLKLNHEAVRNGYYYKPRTTHDLILEHADGLVASTACLGSQFNKHLLRGDLKSLRKLLGRFKDAFGDRFFFEMQINECEDQKKVNLGLAEECGRMGVRLLTNDVHYACQHDVERQDEMIAVARHTPLADPKFWKLEYRSLWFATPRSMLEAGRKWGYSLDKRLYREAIANTNVVADMCSADIYPDNALKPPRYRDESGNEPADPFRELALLAKRGAMKRFNGAIPDAYDARLRHELRVIKKCGMEDFYLVTLDIVRFCAAQKIMVWARGSGCASLVAALVGITPIDPVRFGLLFERFVDPYRANAPDFDLDIDASRRQEVIDWLVKKYGGPQGDRIARIMSLSTFGLKGAIRDLCFAHGMDKSARFMLAEAADQLPPTVEAGLAEAKVAKRAEVIADAERQLRGVASGKALQLMDEHPHVVRAALTAVGRVYGRTKHAAGYVVAPDALEKYMPIDRIGSGDEAVVTTAWGEGLATQDIGPSGIMKVDLLGLVTLSVVARCVEKASKRRGRDVWSEVDPWAMDYSDPRVAAEYATGNGFGLHQLQESGQFLAGFSKRLKPQDVSAVVAMVALYRPGSMDFLDDYLARAKGRASTPKVEEIFDHETAETYGIMVYQEQIMKILHRLGGIELRDAYGVIKAISKQNLEKIQTARESFVAGAGKHHGLCAETAALIFDQIEKFAGYGFNKCLSGSTVLRTAGVNAHSDGGMTIEDAFREFKARTPLGKKMRAGRWRILQMDPDGRVRPGKVKAIYDNGVRDVFEVRTKSGRRIVATANHKLLTTRGYKLVSDLTAADSLVCMGKPGKQRTAKTKYTKGYSGFGFPSGEDNPCYVDGATALLEHAQAEALKRSGGECEFCGESGGRMEFAHLLSMSDCGCDVETYHSPANLRHLCNPCHKQLDYDKGERKPAWSKGKPTEPDPVKWVMKKGRERVYDVEMATAQHNFVANGVVSHNSHAASYAALSWITAYLRASYPEEFYWAWLCHTDNAKGKGDGERKVESFMRAAQRSGLQVLRPTIARSGGQWRISKSGALVAPLSMIVGVGEEAGDRLRAAWLEHKWPDIWSFLQWCDENKSAANSRVVKALAASGALDPLGVDRFKARDITGVFADLRSSQKNGPRAQQVKKMAADPSSGLFITPDTGLVKLAMEREAFGFAFWSNPWTINRRVEKIAALEDQGKIASESEPRMRGMRRAFHVVSVRKHTDKKGHEMAFATMESPSGRRVDALLFSRAWKEHKKKLRQDAVCLVGGEFDSKGVYIVSDRNMSVMDVDRLEVRGVEVQQVQ